MSGPLRFRIDGRLVGLNEYVRAERSSRYEASSIKRQETERVMWSLGARRRTRFARPVTVRFTWVERDMRRDRDNVAFAKKFILDALVRAGVIPDDSPRWVTGFTDEFRVDRRDPHVEVEVVEETEKEEQ